MRRRREMNKWEVDEHKQWSEKVRSHRFCPHMLDKNRNYEGMWSNKRKSSEPVRMNGFKNETLLRLSLQPKMGEMAQTFISEIEWLAVLKWTVNVWNLWNPVSPM